MIGDEGRKDGRGAGISCLMRTRAIAVGELDIPPPLVILSSVRIFADYMRGRHVESIPGTR